MFEQVKLCILSMTLVVAIIPWKHEIDDTVSKAVEMAYHNLKDDDFACSGNGKPEKTSMSTFLFLQKQKNSEDAIAREGYKYIKVMEFLVKITGKSIQQLIHDNAFQFSFEKQVCERVTPVCTKYINARFRTASGICNNLQNPTWGVGHQPHARYLPPVYDDGISEPRKCGIGGRELPSPRTVSNLVLAGNGRTPKDRIRTLMLFTFGQFIDHDLTFTPLAIDKKGNPLECCDKDKDNKECFIIRIPDNDPHYNRACMDFSRSIPAPFRDGCRIGYREQVNRLTSFIDAGMIYGDSKHAHEILDGKHGELRTSKGNLLPDGGQCVLSDQKDFCQLGGDERVNEFPSLGGMHVMFMRYHNLLARELKSKTGLGSQHVFLETRKIMGAIIQQIVYGEYLPVILSRKIRWRYSLNLLRNGYLDRYDKNLNPTIKNVFATAALRFGHSQIPPELGYKSYSFVTRRTFKSEDVFMDPNIVVTEHGQNLADFTRFLISTPVRKVDRQVENAARNELFRNTNGVALDLMSLNIQRGRDHGLQPYNKWRRWCRLPVAKSFFDLRSHDLHTRLRLRRAYHHVDDIDIFVGGLSETPTPGAVVGPLFECILGRQFRDLKFGDRFWFENSGPGGFTLDQLNSIRKLKFAKIVCDSMKIFKIQKHVFNLPGYRYRNPLVKCDSLPSIDLSLWKDERRKGKI